MRSGPGPLLMFICELFCCVISVYTKVVPFKYVVMRKTTSRETVKIGRDVKPLRGKAN